MQTQKIIYRYRPNINRKRNSLINHFSVEIYLKTTIYFHTYIIGINKDFANYQTRNLSLKGTTRLKYFGHNKHVFRLFIKF